MSGFVYILRSLKNDRFYIGSSTRVQERVKRHNQGHCRSTRYNLPYKLEFFQKFSTIKRAKQVEFRLKKLKRKDIIEQIIKDQMIKTDP